MYDKQKKVEGNKGESGARKEVRRRWNSKKWNGKREHLPCDLFALILLFSSSIKPFAKQDILRAIVDLGTDDLDKASTV